MDSPEKGGAPGALPDFYAALAGDAIAFCGPGKNRLWLDLGCGSGGLGLAILERLAEIEMLLVDPDLPALEKALQSAQARGCADRVSTIAAAAEKLPLPDASVDVVVSRGSFFFWRDRVAGLREVYRVLSPGGRAMIGGGLGSTYPGWARREFIGRRRASLEKNAGLKGRGVKDFMEARKPETFRRLAREAGIPDFEVVGEGGLDRDDPLAGIGTWLRFRRRSAADS